jgi:archaellum component FlaC
MMEFYHKKKTGKLKREGYYEYFAEQLRRLPIKKIDLRKSSEKAIHDDLVNLAKRLIDIKKRVLLISQKFAECSALYPSEERLSRLRAYFDYDEIHPSVLGDFNKERGTVYNFHVSRDGRKIRILIDYLPEEGDRDAVTRTPALDLDFEDDVFCDFVYYSLRRFISESSNRRILGKGNVLNVLQTQITIPCFLANHKENAQVIHKIMNQFKVRTKGLLGKHKTLEELEDEIDTVDEEIERKVHKLYGVTRDEEEVMESAT